MNLLQARELGNSLVVLRLINFDNFVNFEYYDASLQAYLSSNI